MQPSMVRSEIHTATKVAQSSRKCVSATVADCSTAIAAIKTVTCWVRAHRWTCLKRAFTERPSRNLCGHLRHLLAR